MRAGMVRTLLITGAVGLAIIVAIVVLALRRARR
jgi:hypothetical protein